MTDPICPAGGSTAEPLNLSRRIDVIRRIAGVHGLRILDCGCGTGEYVEAFRRLGADAHGIEYDAAKVAQFRARNPDAAGVVVGDIERMGFPAASFDLAVLNEVLEHVPDQDAALREIRRVLKPGGRLIVFAPNRLYPFETHGAYFRGHYRFGNIPLINWLPDPLRDRLAPHVRAYTRGGIRRLFRDLPVKLVHHRVIYPGFDNVSARHRLIGRVLRRGLYTAEKSPLHTFGLSHFLVVRKDTGRSLDPTDG